MKYEMKGSEKFKRNHPQIIIDNDINEFMGSQPAVLLHLIPDSVTRNKVYDLKREDVFDSDLFYPICGNGVSAGRTTNKFPFKRQFFDGDEVGDSIGGLIELGKDGVLVSYESRSELFYPDGKLFFSGCFKKMFRKFNVELPPTA